MMKTMLQRSLLAGIVLSAAALGFAQTPWSETGGVGTFDTANWQVDRYAPGGWQPGATDPLGGQALKLSIANADREDLRPAPYSDLFYTTQGRQRAALKSTEVGGELFIPSSWSTPGNLRRSDVWARDTNPDENWAYYPIVGFINNDPLDPFNPTAGGFQPRFRIWDSNSGWVDLAVTPNYDHYNSFRILDTGTSHKIYINGVLAYTLSGNSYSVPGYQGFKAVFLEGYNFGNAANEATLPDAGYDIYWRNVYAKDGPVANDDDVTVDRDTSVLIDAVSNDYGVHGSIFLDGFGFASHGTVNLQSGKIHYTPDAGYVGPDSFQYSVIDSSGFESTGTVNVTVQYSQPVSLGISPNVLRGGLPSTGTFSVDLAPATETYVATLSSNNACVSVPSTVSFSSGTSATFPITTTQVSTSTIVTVTATFHGTTVRKQLTVRPIQISSCSMANATVLGGVADTTATITLQAAPTVSPVTVALSSSDPAAASVQSSVTFGIGETSKTVPVVTSPVASAEPVTISAATDLATRNGVTRVTPVKITTLAVDHSAMNPGGSGTATITLNGALKAGYSVNVAVSTPGNLLTIPSTVNISGSNTGQFTYSVPAGGYGFKAVVTLVTSLAGGHKQLFVTINR